MHTIGSSGFEWDSAKANANFAKHNVYFADAVSVFEDDIAITIRHADFEQEERWITLGIDALGRILVEIYAWLGETIRLISARKASPRERRQYEEINEA